MNRGGELQKPPLTGRMRSCDRWSIAVFCLMLLLPIIGQLSGHSGAEDVARVERRRPSRPPQWPCDKESIEKLPAGVEVWLDDSFGFRTFLSDLNNVLMDRIGSSASNTILIGSGGWLFHRKGEIEVEYRGTVRVPESEIQAWLEVISAEENWLGNLGIPLLKVLLPVKQTVYPEYLPHWARKQFANRTDLICEAFVEAGSPWIDTREEVIEAKGEFNRPLYYKTDTHWNHRGAFAAYRKIMENVQSIFPQARRIGREDFQIRESPHGIRNLMRIHNYYHGWIEPMTSLVLNSPTRVRSVFKFQKGKWEKCGAEEVGNKRLTALVRTNLVDAPRVIIARDSFGRALAPFLNESFGEILYCSRDNWIDQDLVMRFQPDLVLFLSIEKSLYGGLPKWKAGESRPSRFSWEEYFQENLREAGIKGNGP